MQQVPVRHQRPKPPGSRNKHSRLDSTTELFHSPISTRNDKRRSMELSVQDEDQVDIELNASPALRKSTSMKNIGLGLPSAFTLSGFSKTEGDKGPSPPPAYGPLLSDRITVNTPPTQDIEHDSNAYFSQVDPAQELQLRRRRATDAAEAIGLQLQFSPENGGDDIDGLGEEEIRDQLRIMKRQLDLRDNEINMTASIAQKMLERHEELVSVLPPDIKALIPRLNDFAGLDMAVGTPGRRSRETTGSSAASHDLRSPLESDPALNPMLAFPSPNIPDHHFPGAQCHVHPGESYAEVQQQETDERLAAMEQALADARESEEAQRKVAARLRKDFEKLQRDYERAEAQAIKDNTGSNTVMTPRRKTPSRAGPSRHALKEEVGLGWGTFTFPEFPTEAGPSNWQSPQKTKQSRYTAKPQRPMEGYFRRRRERMQAGASEEPLSAIDETISGLPPASTSVTPARPRVATKGFSPSIQYPRSPVYRMDVTQPDADASPPPSPTRHLRSLAPSPVSSGHLADRMSNMRDFIMTGRSLGSEIRASGEPGIQMDHLVTETPHDITLDDDDDDEDEKDLEILAEISRGRTSSLRKRNSYRLLTLPKTHGLEMPEPPSPLRLAPVATRSASRPRPMSLPMSTLTHRRRVSSPGRELREQIELRRKEEEQRSRQDDGDPKEPEQLEEDTLSVPSRIINDAIILLGLLTEWLEVSLVIVYRVFVEARNGRRPNGAKSLWVGRKRYYL